MDDARLDPNNDLNKTLCELVARCWSIDAMHRPACQAILGVLEGVSIVRQSHGPRLESFTKRNSFVHSGAWLRNSASIKIEQARSLLEGIHKGQFKFHGSIYIYTYI